MRTVSVLATLAGSFGRLYIHARLWTAAPRFGTKYSFSSSSWAPTFACVWPLHPLASLLSSLRRSLDGRTPASQSLSVGKAWTLGKSGMGTARPGWDARDQAKRRNRGILYESTFCIFCSLCLLYAPNVHACLGCRCGMGHVASAEPHPAHKGMYQYTLLFSPTSTVVQHDSSIDVVMMPVDHRGWN